MFLWIKKVKWNGFIQKISLRLRKMEAMFRPSFNVWSFAEWPFASFWLSFTRVIPCQVNCIWIRILAVFLTFDYHENRLSLHLMEMNYFRSSTRINFWTSVLTTVFVVKHLPLWSISFDTQNRHGQLCRWCHTLCTWREYKLDHRVTRKSVWFIISMVQWQSCED